MAKDKKKSALPKDVPEDVPSEQRDEPQLKTPDAFQSDTKDKAVSDQSAEPAETLPEPVLPEFKPGKELKAGTPPPIPKFGDLMQGAPASKPPATDAPPSRRSARRRAAGPVRTKLAANDDAPSIGGLIYALDQKPAPTPFRYAAIASICWAIFGAIFTWTYFSSEMSEGTSFGALFAKPDTFLTFAALLVPIAIVYFLALLAWRSEELRLRSSTMTEVAVRLAEPDRMAEQSVASLGQAVRRQVSFMNDAVSRALGRAGELEALVHNEVSALERSYEENERKIRGLIGELSGERDALLNTSRNVTDTLKTLGTDIPGLIEKLSQQQIKLAQIIQGAGENLNNLESAVGQSATHLENTLGSRTDQLQNVLENYTTAIGSAIGSRTEQIQGVLEDYTAALADALHSRSEHFQSVFDQYGQAMDASLTNRAETLDAQLVERTRALDQAFSDRLRQFDESIKMSTMAIDNAVSERAEALTSALETHAVTFKETIGRQSHDLDEALEHGINAVRRSSENITRQSIKAIEGLAGQSEMLRNVSENLLGQINSVTNRFENQNQSILKAANALESANYKIDNTLQNRHDELAQTLDRLSGKADEFGQFMSGYSTSIEGSLTDAERRAAAFAQQLKMSTEATKQTAFEDLAKLRMEADAEGKRALDDLRLRFANVSNAVTEQLDSLSNRFDQTSDEVRRRTERAASEIATEQARLREQIESLPHATRESTNTMRRALQDQLNALEQLSSLTTRAAQQRDVRLPVPAPRSRASYSGGPRAPEPPARPLNQLPGPAASGPMPRPGPGAGPGAPYSGLPPSSQVQTPAGPMPGAGENRETWSLGDLLARASKDDDPQAGSEGRPPAAPRSYQLNIEVIARALDPTTALAVWSRMKSGQRGVMVRSIYSPEGRIAFDEISRQYTTDPDLRRTVDRYIADFERIKAEADMRDPSGRTTDNHMTADGGRVYLFLAHATGRF